MIKTKEDYMQIISRIILELVHIYLIIRDKNKMINENTKY